MRRQQLDRPTPNNADWRKTNPASVRQPDRAARRKPADERDTGARQTNLLHSSRENPRRRPSACRFEHRPLEKSAIHVRSHRCHRRLLRPPPVIRRRDIVAAPLHASGQVCVSSTVTERTGHAPLALRHRRIARGRPLTAADGRTPANYITGDSPPPTVLRTELAPTGGSNRSGSAPFDGQRILESLSTYISLGWRFAVFK